jgi:hypothetical protein
MWNVVDLMTDGHSVLRDRYRAWSLTLTLAILALSVAATALAFAGEPRVTFIVTARLPVFVGVLACLIFFFTLVDLQFDWRSKSRSHEAAARELARFKSTLRDAGSRIEHGDTVDLTSDYQRTMGGLVEISDRKFLRLKARHLRKVEVSKRIAERPGTPVWIHRAQLFREGTRFARTQRPQPEQPDAEPGATTVSTRARPAR